MRGSTWEEVVGVGAQGKGARVEGAVVVVGEAEQSAGDDAFKWFRLAHSLAAGEIAMIGFCEVGVSIYFLSLDQE